MPRVAQTLALAALLAPASIGAARAEAAPASGTAALSAQSALDFRIVIPDTVQVGAPAPRVGRFERFVSRTTENRADRTVVTVAKP